MNEHLRDRILRRLETLSDERGYQILDYVEFLESKYAERPQPSTTSPFTRFAEAIEDRMRAGKMSAQTISETMGLMNKAMGILNGVAAAGRSMADDLMATAAGTTGPGGSAGAGGAGGTGSATSTSSAAGTPPPSATGSTPPPPSPQGDGPEGSAPQGGPRT